MTANERDAAGGTDSFGLTTGDGTLSDDPHAEYRRQAAEYFGTTSAGLPKSSGPETSRFARPADAHAKPPHEPGIYQPPSSARQPQWSAGPAGMPTMSFGFQPWHALWALSGVCALAAVLSSSAFGWIVLALVCAAGGWYARSRNAVWPPDVRDLLARWKVVPSTPDGNPPVPSPPVQPVGPVSIGGRPMPASQPEGGLPAPPIPFRPLTIPELFTGAAKIMSKNWPTLVGIPVGILLTFLLTVYLALTVITRFIVETSSSLNGGTLLNMTDFGSFMTGMVTLLIVFSVVVAAIALPADALLLGLSVIATDNAVRGQPVRLTDVWVAARRRMFAVCRMTLTFYAMSALPYVVLTALLFLGAGMLGLYLSLALTFAVFAASILFSLSPVVLALEGRGVAESLRRSVSLSKPAWGRIIGIHLLWSVCFLPIMLITLVFGFNLVAFAVAAGALLASFRVLQVLIYTDLRMRQEHYEQQLIQEWTHNTGHNPI